MKVKKIWLSIIGLILCGVGVSLFLLSDLGVDPNSVFITGVSNKLDITYGLSSLIINGSILLIVWLIDKSYVNISSILAIFLIGFTVDIFLLIYNLIIPFPISNILIRIIILLIGLIILCLGVVTYIEQDLGIAAFDSISEIISKKRKLEFKYVRITIDIILLIIGWTLGGTVGLGTIIIASLTGPTINLIRNTAEIE